jgi:RNA polymerase sigma-54 factor
MSKQILHQSLQQKLSPQQIQLMKLIELSTLELEQKVKDEVEINPALDDEQLSSDLDNEQLSSDLDNELNEEKVDSTVEFDITQYLSDDDIPTYKLYSNNDSEENIYDKAPIIGGQTQFDILKSQLGEIKLDVKDKKIGKYIIGCIDEYGYIRRSAQEISDDLVFKENIVAKEEEIERIITIVQTFDPAGLGARDLKECLLLQLNRKNQTKEVIFAVNIITQQFKQFVNKHYSKIQDRFKVTQLELKSAILEIEKLNPRPAASVNENKYTQQIIPDFTITINNEDISFVLNSRNAPMLNVSKEYLNMLNLYKEKGGNMSKDKKQALMFVKQKLDSAKWFINAIQQRQQTLIATLTSIVMFQKKYFLSGDEKDLVPMILKDIAENIHMDISTISRVVNSKYVETPYGIKSLKYFFSESMSKTDGESVSVKEIKLIIKDRVDEESSGEPLNDQELVDFLLKKGYKIARRTIAKYREQMNIPVARLRKKL